MFEFVIPPGAKVPVPHYHKEVDEVIYDLEGITTKVDGKKVEISTDELLFIPRGAVHHYDNGTQRLVKLLIIMAPSSMGPAYFREMSKLIKSGIPPDPKQAAEIMIRHGFILGAPL
jgi:quercetin dioxygenase-like cupin family protein